MSKDNLHELDTTAANNTDFAGVSIAEGTAPSNVNNAERALGAMIKKNLLDESGTLTLTGTNTLTITTNQVFASYVTGMTIRATAAADNTGAVTLSADGVGAKNVVENIRGTETELSPECIINGVMYDFMYDTAINSSAGGWWMKPVGEARMPPGAGMTWDGATIPKGFLEKDGSSLLRATYPGLFDALGTTHGAADGTHFNLPDWRGKFPRHLDDAVGTDPDYATRTIGSDQADELASHLHTYAQPAIFATMAGGGSNTVQSTTTANTGSTGGSETRPVNIATYFIIKV